MKTSNAEAYPGLRGVLAAAATRWPARLGAGWLAATRLAKRPVSLALDWLPAVQLRRLARGWLRRLLAVLLAITACVAPLSAVASPLSSQVRAELATGHATLVVVEFDTAATDRAATAERVRRHLAHDDPAILALRAQGYATARAPVTAAIAGTDAVRTHDYTHFPMSVWRLSSLDALSRLQAYPGVRAVHQNITLHPVAVSDLPFISQPQAAAEGAIGTGTTIAVIDGGLGTNYLSFSDFGTCTAINTPSTTCRVVFNQDLYSGSAASSETMHGTNVSAIALGVAPGAKLAMLDPFQGASANSSDIMTALDTAIENQALYNIVAVNLSLGDGSSHSTQCGATSVFATPMASAISAGIQPVVAAGNNGSKTGLADPACVPGVISVGAVYDGSYGTVSWLAATDTNGQCTDVSAADHVTCFSQSASYLSILAPGSFVNAPDPTFQESGTSQATPHISGSIAVLHARYPAEPFSEDLQRLQLTGVKDTDSANGQTTPRLNLLAAVNQGTAIALSGTGPLNAVTGQTGTYSLTVTNNGPLAATDVVVTDSLPASATFNSATTGCSFASGKVTCSVAGLAVGASVTLTITVTWKSTGHVYDTAYITADQINSSSQQVVAFGVSAGAAGDGPLPLWSYALLGLAFFALASRQLQVTAGR